MTKLDEIEAKANLAVGRMDNEIALLIRAVRQLGMAVRDHDVMVNDGYMCECNRNSPALDPDVLELLEGG